MAAAAIMVCIFVWLIIVSVRVNGRKTCIKINLLKEVYLNKRPYKILPEMEELKKMNEKKIWSLLQREALIVDTYCGFSSMSQEIAPNYSRMRSLIQILRNRRAS